MLAAFHVHDPGDLPVRVDDDRVVGVLDLLRKAMHAPDVVVLQWPTGSS